MKKNVSIEELKREFLTMYAPMLRVISRYLHKFAIFREDGINYGPIDAEGYTTEDDEEFLQFVTQDGVREPTSIPPIIFEMRLNLEEELGAKFSKIMGLQYANPQDKGNEYYHCQVNNFEQLKTFAQRIVQFFAKYNQSAFTWEYQKNGKAKSFDDLLNDILQGRKDYNSEYSSPRGYLKATDAMADATNYIVKQLVKENPRGNVDDIIWSEPPISSIKYCKVAITGKWPKSPYTHSLRVYYK